MLGHLPGTAHKSQVMRMQTLLSLSWINTKMQTLAKLMIATCLITIVGACGGGGANTSTSSTFTVGGAVTGLIAPFKLTLQNNGGDSTDIAANGAFSFKQTIAAAGNYSVTVSSQPSGQSCVVSAGSGSNISANLTSAEVKCSPATDFAEVTGAFPDPLLFYNYVDPVEDPTSNASALFAEAIDLDGDGKKELVMVMGKGWWNVYESRSARSRVTILKLNAQNIFVDVTTQMLTGINSLAGFPSEAKVADLNGDGKPDLLVALSQDDGRQGGNGSLYTAQLAVMLSGVDGKYTWKSFGAPGFWQSINAGRDGAGNPFVMGGGSFTLPNEAYTFLGGAFNPVSGAAPNVNSTAFEFLTPAGKSTSETLINVTSNNLLGLEAYTRSSSGEWLHAGVLQTPYPKIGTVQILTWTNSLATADVLNMNGVYVAGQGTGIAISKSCQLRLTPASSPTAIFLMPQARINNYVPGVQIRESDLTPGFALIGATVINGQIAASNPSIGNEETSGVNANEFDCKDVNGDGYDDIIVYAMRRGTASASPIVYLNNKDGTFSKSTYSSAVNMSPDSQVDLESSIMADFDGDGIADVVIFPSSPPSQKTSLAFKGVMKFYKGMRSLQK